MPPNEVGGSGNEASVIITAGSWITINGLFGCFSNCLAVRRARKSPQIVRVIEKMPTSVFTRSCTSHHKLDTQIPYCTHTATVTQLHIYFNPQISTNLLQIAQAIEHYHMPHPRDDASWLVQSFTIRGVRYDKNVLQNYDCKQLLGDGEAFQLQAQRVLPCTIL